MKPLHQRILGEIAEERQRLASRRHFLGGSAKLVGGGALAVAVAGVPVGKRLRGALAQTFADDLDVLNYALTLEHLEFAFYRDALEAFAEEDFDEGVYAELEAIRDHEEAHVQALTETIASLGGSPVTEQEYDFGYDDVDGFLEVAMVLENTGVAAYAGAAPAIEDEAVLAAALGIHSVEARHAAYLNTRNGETAFPEAFDEALSRDEVLGAAASFVVSEDGAATPEDAAKAGTAVVDIDDYEFIPAALEIAVGTTVTWTNVGGVPHTATGENEEFDTGVLSNGERASYTFEEAGEFPYVCRLHPRSMKATVIVS